MAEQVQEVLDAMVAPLADLMDRNIFSQPEIHAIVARRRESEYLLRRPTPRKADFLRYIQDELQLERLRALRTKKQQALERERLAKLGKLEEDSMTKKNHIGDSHIKQHIHILFRRTLRKYNKEDVSIYLQYAETCKALKSFNKLSEVYSEAVQIHPREPGLWIEAASHEFFHRQSVSTARVLLQRALRVNQKSKDLWLQSFALEFHHIAKMKGRRAILQLDDDNNKQNDSDSENLGSPLYSIAKIVYDNAIEALPKDVSFRLSFLDLCRTFPFSEEMVAHIYETIKRDFQQSPKAWIARANHVLEQQRLKQKGAESDKSAFKIAPEELSEDEAEQDTPVKKRRKRSSSKDDSHRYNDDPVLAVLGEAVETISTSDMILEAVHFAWGYWENASDVFSEPKDAGEARKRILSFIQQQLEDASANSEVYSTSLALEYSRFFARSDDNVKALQVLQQFVEQGAKKNVHTSIWMELANCTLQTKSAKAARNVLKMALDCMPLNHPDYLKMLMENLGAEIAIAPEEENDSTGGNHERVTDVFQCILLMAAGGSVAKQSIPEESRAGDSDHPLESIISPFGINTVAEACLHYLMHCIKTLDPLKGVRKACNLVLHQSNYLEPENERIADDVETLAVFFDKCLEVEVSNVKAVRGKSKSERKKDRVVLRQLYEKAISTFSNIPSLAVQYRQGRNDASVL